MRKLILILLCAVVVNARWSFYNEAKEIDEIKNPEWDWYNHGVFYQVELLIIF